MGRYRSRSRSYSPRRRKRYDDPRERSRRDRRSPAPSGLLVRNISLNARPEDLRIPFERFGPVKDVYLPKDYYSGEPRGFGFVKFRYAEDATEAKQRLDRAVIGGREIRIVFAEENRKTPQEMRRTTRPSGRGSYRRRSPSRSPRRRYSSYSPSPSPLRHDSRDRRTRDAYYSPRRSRSISRSVSLHSERNHGATKRSSRRSRSMSQSLSLNGDRNKRSTRYLSPGENVQTAHDEDYARSRSESPRGAARSPLRSPSQSYRYVLFSFL
ncbi:unnamed protein product [Ilex paraguariensis]|uniref:RRM domain-containing protein n=1 Tax=Ilex paraguariensis TaxID=185542 RepID=A0ABC8UIL9_9AQUA